MSNTKSWVSSPIFLFLASKLERVNHAALAHARLRLHFDFLLFSIPFGQKLGRLFFFKTAIKGHYYRRAFSLYNIFIKLNNYASSYDTLYLVDNSNSDVVTYWTIIRTHVVPDRHYYTPITSYLVHIQLLYGILYTTTSRPNTNTSTTVLPYMQSFFSFGQHVIYQTLQRRYKITGSST